MREVPRRQGPLVAALLLPALAVSGWSAFSAISRATPLSRAGIAFLLAVSLAALILELVRLETPFLGHGSLAILAYAVLSLDRGPQLAVSVAFGCLLIRTLARSSEGPSRRLLDFSLALLSAAAAVHAVGLAFPRAGDPLQLWALPGMLVMGAAMLSYAGADLLLCLPLQGLLGGDQRLVWGRVRMRFRLSAAGMIPLAWVASFFFHVGVREGSFNFWMPAVLLLPLWVVHRSLRFGIEEEALHAHDKTEKALQQAAEELLDYKNQNRALMADLQKRVDEITILFEMGQQLGASKDMEKTLEIIISMIRRLLIYQSCVIYLVNEKGALVPARCVSPHADVVELSPLLHLEESMVNLVVQSKKPVLVSDMQGDSEHRIFNDEKSIMCVPLIVKDDIIGVIYVGTLRPGSYSDDHVHTLETLANPAAISIKSAQFHALQEDQLSREQRLRQQANERNNQLNVLYHLGAELNRSVRLADIVEIVVEKLGQLVPYQSCIILISRAQDGQLAPCKVKSPYAGLFTGFTSSPDDQETILGWVATNKRHLLLHDTKESRFNNIIVAERSFILMPLITEDEVLGEIYVGDADPGTYDDETLNLVEMVAAQAAMAIQKALLFEKTEGLAITDGVTGLYTHRYFQERLSEEVRWSERYGKPLSLIMVDTDNFKKFNDTLGHPEGDKLLKEIAALLRSYTRESDLVCRYGGDEFTLILKDTEKESAVKTAERIREAFQLRFGDLAVKVTASIGVSNFPLDARGKSELVTAADTALYRSKHGGRNRVSYAAPLDATQPASH